jgi:hypothetical protein
VFHKKTNKIKCSTKKPANKKKLFHKKTSKTNYSTKKPTNKYKKTSVPQKNPQTKKQIFKISKLKEDLKNKKTFKFFLARPKVSNLRISKRITFLCM